MAGRRMWNSAGGVLRHPIEQPPIGGAVENVPPPTTFYARQRRWGRSNHFYLSTGPSLCQATQPTRNLTRSICDGCLFQAAHHQVDQTNVRWVRWFLTHYQFLFREALKIMLRSRFQGVVVRGPSLHEHASSLWSSPRSSCDLSY
jgi:hypothetical protein